MQIPVVSVETRGGRSPRSFAKDPQTKICNREVIRQAIWPTERPILNRDDARAPTAIHGSSGLKFLPIDEVNARADCLENRFTPHDLCDIQHERRVEANVQVLLGTEVTIPTEKIKPCDLQKLVNSLELTAFRKITSGTFQEDHWFTSHICLIAAFGCHIFHLLGRKLKW